jgi:hypothetical protein
MGMNQVSYGTCFLKKAFRLIPLQLCVENFDSRLGLQAEMLTQIDFSEATVTK